MKNSVPRTVIFFVYNIGFVLLVWQLKLNDDKAVDWRLYGVF